MTRLEPGTARVPRALSAVLLSVLGVGCEEPGSPPLDPVVAEAVETIRRADLTRRLRVIAHDSMRGRRTPSPELDAVAAWAADELSAMGLEAARADGWIQTYEIETVVPDLVASEARIGDHLLAFGDQLGFLFGPQAEADLEAGLMVLSGSTGWERRLGAADLGGQAVVIVGTDAGPRTRDAQRMLAAVRGAGAAAVLFASALSDDAWAETVALQAETSVTRPRGFAPSAPVLSIRDAALDTALAPFGVSAAELRERAQGRLEITAFPDARLTISIRNRTLDRVQAPNVVGVLPGSDAALADEAVVLSAHMDHVGVGRPDAEGDSIYNGADDDGSGTVALLEIAEALAQMPERPRRSVVILLVSGEEQGLWGSRWFVENPPFPVHRMVANLNLDMVGRNDPERIVAIGKEHSDLGETLDALADRHADLGLEPIDDPWPEERFYFRSDHVNFARAGVPVLFFFSGTHEDYHQPGDEVDEIDGDKLERVSRLVFHLTLELANRDSRPRWDPGSREEIVGGRR